MNWMGECIPAVEERHVVGGEAPVTFQEVGHGSSRPQSNLDEGKFPCYPSDHIIGG